MIAPRSPASGERRDLGGLGRLGGQPAREDLRDAVASHRDAEQPVCRLHRALLVGDHDELGAARIAAQQRQEAVQVQVVQRGLDLVQDVEGAGRARKTANRKASAVIDFSPPESSVRRLLDLPAGVISISTPGSCSSWGFCLRFRLCLGRLLDGLLAVARPAGRG